MGTYRQPDIIVNSKGLLEQNKAISDFNKSLDSQFDKLRQQQIANNKISEQQERERQKRVLKDANILNKELKDSGLLNEVAGESTKEVVQMIRDEYYKCAGSTSTKCSEDMAYWLSLPEQIASGIGVQQALSGEYDNMIGINPGDPNSLDLDRVDPNNFKFGREFHENGGKNVKCNYDPKTKQIYWTIADKTYTAEEIAEMDEATRVENGIPVDYTEGDYTVPDSGARMNNAELIRSQSDPNNKVPFFPRHGDPKIITSIMHGGSPEDGVEGAIGVGLKDGILTEEIKVDDGQGGIKIEKKITTNTAEVNDKIRKRLVNYDFKDTLNAPGTKNLYGGALKTNLQKLDQLRNKDINDLTITEQKLAETWYGSDWREELNNPDAVLEEDDPIAVYKEGGTAAFGPYIGGDPNNAETNSLINFQRGVIENSLIFNYEDEYLEQPKKGAPSEAGDLQNIAMDDDRLSQNLEINRGKDAFNPGLNIETKPGTESIGGTTIPEEQINIEDKNITTSGFTPQSGGMNSYADDKITVFDNTNIDNLTGSPDEVPGLNFMIGIENTVGCMSGGKPVPCGGYGADEEEIKETITRINKENLGKGTYKDNKGRDKKALNNPTMWGDDWDKLPEEFKTSILQYNFNSAWDPRVVTMIASGDIDIADRGEYHRNADKLQKKWDEVQKSNNGKGIDYNKLDYKKLRNEMTDVYKHTYDNGEKWKYGFTKEPVKPVAVASQEVRDKYKKDKAQYDKYAAKAGPIIKELNLLAGKLKAETDPTKKQKLQEKYKKYAKDNNFNVKDQTFLPDNYPSYEARMNLVNKRYKT